jgi:hypothetical protein
VNPEVPKVLFVRVERPVFDLVGVVLSSLSIAGLCAATALVLGIALGVSIILRRRKHPPMSLAESGLVLLEARRP